jgi:hydroxylamine dehydrogenase
MSLKTKQIIIAGLGFIFLLSLIFVQWLEVSRRQIEAGLRPHHVTVPASSARCVDCHKENTPGIVDHWIGSRHAQRGVGCFECHQAERDDPDGFNHYGANIATVVTPRDCARCHSDVADEFSKSHHAAGGNILASLDNFLAETVEGSRTPFNPHSPTPGKGTEEVNGLASAFSGCLQCHGSKVGFQSVDGGMITVDDLKPDESGKPTNQEAVQKILKNENGKPLFHSSTWPNTGIGRLNMDGSRGSCTACHSRHDFSPRRARQPENCGKCHLGPDHPQKEIYEESKHGVAYRDLKDHMNLDSESWVLGKDYSQAPTCATCHMSGHKLNEGKITHDPGERISWTNRPPISLLMDTDEDHHIVKETDPAKRSKLIHDTWQAKRGRMKQVCSNCHTPDYINSFYKQYDDLIILFNEKFAKPGQKIVEALKKEGLISPTQFDDEIEWTWFYLWHHEGRRARHGASMMAPDYTHWHGMFEVSERFYMELIPQAQEITHHARQTGKAIQAEKVENVINGILARPEHKWFVEGAEDQAEKIRKAMAERYGMGK